MLNQSMRLQWRCRFIEKIYIIVSDSNWLCVIVEVPLYDSRNLLCDSLGYAEIVSKF